jgi:hypothetical protein
MIWGASQILHVYYVLGRVADVQCKAVPKSQSGFQCKHKRACLPLRQQTLRASREANRFLVTETSAAEMGGNAVPCRCRGERRQRMDGGEKWMDKETGH